MPTWMANVGDWVQCGVVGCAHVEKDMLVMTKHYKRHHNGLNPQYSTLQIISDAACLALIGTHQFNKKNDKPRKDSRPAGTPYPPRPKGKGHLTYTRKPPTPRNAPPQILSQPQPASVLPAPANAVAASQNVEGGVETEIKREDEEAFVARTVGNYERYGTSRLGVEVPQNVKVEMED